MARRGADFGVVIDAPITVDMKNVKARKDAVVRQSNEGVTNWLKTMASYVRKLVTELSGGVFGYLDSVLERHSFDEFGELI